MPPRSVFGQSLRAANVQVSKLACAIEHLIDSSSQQESLVLAVVP